MVLDEIIELLKEPKIFIPLIIIIAIITFFVLTAPPKEIPIPSPVFDPVAYCAEQSTLLDVSLVYNPDIPPNGACVEVTAQPEGTTPVPADPNDPAFDGDVACASIGKTYSQTLNLCITGGAIPSNEIAEDYCSSLSAQDGIPRQFDPDDNRCEPTEAYKLEFCLEKGLLFDVQLDKCVVTEPDAIAPTLLTDSLCSSTPSVYFYALYSIAVGNSFCECPNGSTYFINDIGVPVCGVPTLSIEPPPILPPPSDGIIPTIIDDTTQAISDAISFINPIDSTSIWQQTLIPIVYDWGNQITQNITDLADTVLAVPDNFNLWAQETLVQPVTQTIDNTIQNIQDTVDGATDWLCQSTGFCF